VVQHVPPGRHRAPGHGRYIALRRAPVRHRRVTTTNRPRRAITRIGVVAMIGTLTAADVALGVLIVQRGRQGTDTTVAAAPGPAIAIPPPPAGRPARPTPRGERRRSKVRPPVLLGPRHLAASLAAYCTGTVSAAIRARPTEDGWACDRRFVRDRAIDMDAACRWLYGRDAWAGMLNDDNQQTWRCYRDPS
jgi:hypothetical protein